MLLFKPAKQAFMYMYFAVRKMILSNVLLQSQTMNWTESWGESIVFRQDGGLDQFRRKKMAVLKLSTYKHQLLVHHQPLTVLQGFLYIRTANFAYASHAFALISADRVVAIKMGDGLDQIDDMGEICEIMKSLQIPTKGLKNCEEMKTKLRDFLKESGTKRVSEVSILFFSIAIA